MSITVETTPYGRPALEMLARLVQARKEPDPLAPVTVVVPTNGVGVSARRWLATSNDAGIAGLSLMTTYRVAELLGAPALAAAGRRPVSTPVLAAAVRQVLGRDAGVFDDVADHPSTTEALVRAHAELSHCPAEALHMLSGQGERPNDVVRIHRSIRADLGDGWYDERDLLESARQAVESGSPVLDDLGTIILFLPQELSPSASELIMALAVRTTVTVMAGLTGADDADADVHRSLGRLGVEAGAHDPSPGQQPRIVSVSDADEEARTAVDEIIDAARRGVPLERMAVLYPAEVPHGHILREHLDGAGIAWNGRGVTALKDRMVGRWVLDLLELADQRFSRAAVMHLFTSAVVRVNGGRVPLTGWERASREAGVVAGRDQWDQRLAAHATSLRRAADEEETSDEPRHWLVERLRRHADEADALRTHSLKLIDEVAGLDRLDTWGELAAATRGLVEHHLGREHERRRWPDVELEAAQKVDLALDRLAALDPVEPRATRPLFHHTLELELDADLGRHGRSGVGVLVGPYTHALGTDLEMVVLVGLAEGVAPTRPTEDPLLLDREREPIADVLRPRAARVGLQHRHFLVALAAAASRPVLVYPRGDLRRSMERAPSRWLLEQVELHTGSRDLSAGDPTVVGSFAGRVRTSAFPATEQLHHLHSLGLEDGGEHDPPDSVAWRRGVELVLARRGDAFTRFDGNLGHLDSAIIGRFRDGRMISPTRLESYAKCPHGHLVQHVLSVRRAEDPEELLEISPRERGTLMHEVLEEWLRAELAIGVPGPTEPWSEEAQQRLLAIGERACDRAEARGITGHPIMWARDRTRILHDLRRLLTADHAHRTEFSTTPHGPELPFGSSIDDAVVISLGDGTSVHFRGSIDRVDRAADGMLHVCDYKTGSARDYAGLSGDNPDKDGTFLQLPVYALAARQALGDESTRVKAEYWFNSTKGQFRRVGYEVTEAVVDRFHETVRTLVDSFESGLFPLHPEEPGFRVFNACWYCDPDELGTSDTHQRWLHVRTQAELHDLVSLIEPDALEVTR